MKNSVINTLCLALISNISYAASVTTSSSIGLLQSVGQINTETTGTSSINTTSLSPQLSVKYNNRRLSAAMDYSLYLVSDNEASNTFTNQTLNLTSNYIHILNSWNSQFRTQIIQKNTSDTSILTPVDVTTSNDTRDYLISSVSTKKIFRLSEKTQLTSILTASEQGFKTDTKQNLLSATLDFKATEFTPSLSFRSNFKTSRSNNAETSSSFENVLDYIINQKVSTYFSSTLYSSSNQSLDKSRVAIGINWKFNPISYLAFDAGQFGNASSWAVDSKIQLRRTSFFLNHSEKISRPNQTFIDSNSNNLTDSTSNILSLNKTSSVQISRKLRRMTLNLSLSNSQTFSDFSSSANRTSEAAKISLNYLLSKFTTITYAFTNDTITTTEKNQLLNYSVNWTTKANRRSSYNVKLAISDQTSSKLGFDYTKTQVDFNYRLTF